MQEVVQRRRPLGVTIIAVLLLIEAIVELIIGIAIVVGIFALGATAARHGHGTVGSVVDVLGGVLGGTSIIIGILTLIFAIGLFGLRRWAFWLTIIIEAISVIRQLLEFTHPGYNVTSIILGLIIPVVILVYFLLDSNVRAAFRV